LLELIRKGLTRDEAYDKIQKIAFDAKERGVDFKEAVNMDDGVRSILDADEIGDIFDFRYHLKNVDRIFKKVGI
jgi:adenylosuccinate lyase